MAILANFSWPSPMETVYWSTCALTVLARALICPVGSAPGVSSRMLGVHLPDPTALYVLLTLQMRGLIYLAPRMAPTKMSAARLTRSSLNARIRRRRMRGPEGSVAKRSSKLGISSSSGFKLSNHFFHSDSLERILLIRSLKNGSVLLRLTTFFHVFPMVPPSIQENLCFGQSALVRAIPALNRRSSIWVDIVSLRSTSRILSVSNSLKVSLCITNRPRSNAT
mmetsp:Transcript_1178/g.1812  ORF Transcript_1178/g.1812 Transcript_1178/m.1812 type:complete len:223 (+) Transcript_1178:2089-2757(+)